MIFDPSIALHFGQGFILPNLVVIGHSWAIWSLVDLGCPLLNLWPQHRTSLRSRVLPTNLVAIGHSWAIWTLTPDGPWLTPVWPWPQYCTSLMSGVLPTKFGGHIAFLNNLTSGWPLIRSLRKYAFKPCGPIPYSSAKFQLDTSKHDETHNRTYLHTYLDILVV